MCGLWAWLAEDAGWSPELAEACVRGAGARGPHGWGVATWLNGGEPGTSAIVKKPGGITEPSGRLRWTPAPGVVVGQCRLATSGGPTGYTDLAALQPLCCGSTVIAHNGNIYNAAPLARQYAFQPRTSCDSEVLGLLLDWVYRGGGDFLVEAAAMLTEVSPSSPLACVALLPDGRVFAASRGLPLHARLFGPGLYLCSRALPDGAPMEPNSALLARCTPKSGRPVYWSTGALREVQRGRR